MSELSFPLLATGVAATSATASAASVSTSERRFTVVSPSAFSAATLAAALARASSLARAFSRYTSPLSERRFTASSPSAFSEAILAAASSATVPSTTGGVGGGRRGGGDGFVRDGSCERDCAPRYAGGDTSCGVSDATLGSVSELSFPLLATGVTATSATASAASVSTSGGGGMLGGSGMLGGGRMLDGSGMLGGGSGGGEPLAFSAATASSSACDANWPMSSAFGASSLGRAAIKAPPAAPSTRVPPTRVVRSTPSKGEGLGCWASETLLFGAATTTVGFSFTGPLPFPAWPSRILRSVSLPAGATPPLTTGARGLVLWMLAVLAMSCFCFAMLCLASSVLLPENAFPNAAPTAPLAANAPKRARRVIVASGRLLACSLLACS